MVPAFSNVVVVGTSAVGSGEERASGRQLIVVVEDEEAIAHAVVQRLRGEGFDVEWADDGVKGVELCRTLRPDLVVLDLMLPGIDGLEVCRQVQADRRTPVVMLTARDDEADLLVGLAVGADDYLTKPFSPRELVARVQAVLRRERDRGAADPERRLRFERLTIDLDQRSVAVDGDEVALSALEFDLLAALAGSPKRVFSRTQLLERVWGYDFYGDERVVDVHIRNLRAKIGDDARNPTMIATVRGVGYKFTG